jgi:hypothetical protein
VKQVAQISTKRALRMYKTECSSFRTSQQASYHPCTLLTYSPPLACLESYYLHPADYRFFTLRLVFAHGTTCSFSHQQAADIWQLFSSQTRRISWRRHMNGFPRQHPTKNCFVYFKPARLAQRYLYRLLYGWWSVRISSKTRTVRTEVFYMVLISPSKQIPR